MSQPSSADCLAAPAAPVIKRLRHAEAGQATAFSKRAFAAFFSRQLPVRLNADMFTICVPVASPAFSLFYYPEDCVGFCCVLASA